METDVKKRRLMDNRSQLPKGTASRMQKLMRQVTRAREFKNLQSIYLLATTEWPLRRVAEIIGVHQTTVNNALAMYLTDGEQALLVDDHGYSRRHAKLTIAEEFDVLTELEKDINNGIDVTKKYAESKVNKLTGKHVSAYDIFHRHGWVKGEQLPWEPGMTRPPRAWLPGSGEYQPKNLKSQHLVNKRGLESQHILSLTEEEQVLQKFQTRGDRGVTRVEVEAALSKKAGRRVSRQTTMRTLLRHGWERASKGRYTTWVIKMK